MGRKRIICIELPARFYDDHRSRDLPERGISRVLHRTKRTVFVEMDDRALADLRSDAEYYADASTDHGIRGLAASARATARKLALAE